MILVALATPLPWLLFLLLDALFPFPQDVLRGGPCATQVLDREGRVLRSFIGGEEAWRFEVPLRDVSPRLAQATIAVEDKRFRSHPGVDPLAVLRAVGQNVRHRRVVSGASTLTMQVVRLLRPRPRTLASKAIEAFRAVQLERLLTKDEILALYLNRAPYGGNLVGAEAAARAYFSKHARDLTLAEAALLAGLPQSPSRLRPDRHASRAKARRDRVLARMRACGFISPGALATALREPVRVERCPFPFEAPHLARLVRRTHPAQAALHTTIDRRIQHLAETTLCEGVAPLRDAGITNGAVVVIENRTAAVRALVGSVDFHAEEHDGQVNGATAPRSPGSALKPFTYALAFEHGIATPDTVLADVPVNYTGYEPENFDHDFRGAVTARDALRESLNLPAVGALNEVGVRRLHAFLRELGLSTLDRDADHYGLALTLGSTEVTLLDLTSAYATLACLGVHKPYRLLETEPVGPGRRALSEGAAWLVADVLSRPEERVRMAWKTGTSYGHRDAWTVAYTPRYTVGVWVGNFEPRPARELVGIRVAAPIAKSIIRQLYGGGAVAWYPTPETVATRPICPASGMPAGEHCPAATDGWYLLGRSAHAPCSVHVAAKIDAQTGTCLCPHCQAGRSYTVEVVESWPVALAAWLRARGSGRRLMPAHFAGCPRGAHRESPPQLLSPTAGQTYLLVEGGSRQQLLLKAASRMPRLYWFVDGALHATGAPLSPVFWPLRRGPHTIACADEMGRSTAVAIEVR